MEMSKGFEEKYANYFGSIILGPNTTVHEETRNKRRNTPSNTLKRRKEKPGKKLKGEHYVAATVPSNIS